MNNIPKEQVLDLTQKLWAERGEISIDEIDGAFYWRLCRGELVTTLKDLIARAAELKEEERDAFHARLAELREMGVEREELVRNISAMPWIQHQQEFSDHMYKMEQEIPDVMRQLDKPARMRAPLFAYYAGPSPSIPCFQTGWANQGSGLWFFLGVRDSQWRGDDVERVLREEAEAAEASNAEFLKSNDRSKIMPGEALIFIDLKFYNAGELELRSHSLDLLGDGRRRVRVESPVVMCTASYPLPASGLIAAAYDAVAIRQNKWPSRLYGAGVSRNHGPEVAIRTWAIGLLVGSGHSQREAHRLVDEILGQPVAGNEFSVNRGQLVDRVPEAEPFLYQRARRRR